ncbi:MAG: Crp/Fnr family transcriptional regulator, partial [Bulleidia sp.]
MLLTRYYFADEFTAFLPVLETYGHESCSFARDEYLCRFNQSLDKIYYIRSGMTRLSVLHDSGEEKLIGFWARGSMFPIICTEQKFNLEYSLLLKAETDVEAIVFRPDVFIRMLSENKDIMTETIDHYCRFCNMLLFSNVTQAYEDTRTRICSLVYSYTCFTGEKKRLPLSQNDIA